MSLLRSSVRFISVSFLILLPFVLAQQDPASCTVSCRFVVVPTVGPPGLNGTAGPQGPIGPIGATGQTGAQGAQGVMGPAGSKGDKGDKGDTGATGQTGQTGLQGPQGVQGPKGDTGVFDPSSTLVNPTITGTITGSPTIASPTITGKVQLSQNPTLTVGSDVDCIGTQSGTTVTITSGSCTFSYGSVGSLVTWSDGATALVLASDAEVGSLTATLSVSASRPTATTFKVTGSGNVLTPSMSAFQDKLVIKGFTGGVGSCSATIDLTKMKGARSAAVWSFPRPPNSVTTPVNYFVGEDVAQTVSNKVINASVITASETNGHIRMKNWGSLGISDPTDTGSPDYTMINVAITGNLVTATAGKFYPSNIGSVIEWSDGAIAVIENVGPIGTGGSTTCTVTRIFQTARDWQMVKFWTADTMLSSNFAMFRDKIALKAVIGASGSALTIDMTKMRVDAGVRHQTSWTFPHPGPAGQQNYFVGEETVQTLTNKVLASPTISGTITATSATINGGTLVNPSITGVVSGTPRVPVLLGTSHAGHSCQSATSSSGTLTMGSGICSFTARTVGSLVLWNDGSTSRVLGFSTGYIITIDDTVSRPSQPFRIWNSDQHFSADGTYTNMREPRIHNSLASVQLSLASMTSGQIATWNFPAVTGSQTFVGVDAVQSLTNKAIVHLVGGGTAITTATLGGGAGTGATVSIAAGSTDSAGQITVNTGTNPLADQLLVRIQYKIAYASKAWVSITPGNSQSSPLAGNQQVYVSAAFSTNQFFEIFPGITPLAAGKQYIWFYHVIG